MNSRARLTGSKSYFAENVAHALVEFGGIFVLQPVKGPQGPTVVALKADFGVPTDEKGEGRRQQPAPEPFERSPKNALRLLGVRLDTASTRMSRLSVIGLAGYQITAALPAAGPRRLAAA